MKNKEQTNLQVLIGKIPSDWKKMRLKEVIIDEKGGDWGQEKKGKNSFLRCYVLRGTDFQNAQNGILEKVPIRYISPDSFGKRKLEIGEILIELSGGSKDQPTGRIFIVANKILQKCDGNILFSNFVKKLKIDVSKCAPEYFYRYWQLLYNLGRTTIYEKRTTGIRNFKCREFIDNEQIPLPPLPEQKKIVFVLDGVKSAVRVQDKLIEKTKELKRSLMQKLFREGAPSFSKGRKLKKTEIGEIPENWEVMRLGEVASKIKAGGTPNTEEKKFWNGNIVFTLIEDLVNAGKFLKSAKASITELGLENSSSWVVPTDSIILSLYATVGKPVINKIPVAITQNMLGIVPNKEVIDLEFLYYGLENSRKNLWKYTDLSVHKHITTTQAKKILISAPPLSEQHEIAEILQTIDQKIEIEQKKKILYEELFKSMLNQLMTGKIRVKNLNL